MHDVKHDIKHDDDNNKHNTNNHTNYKNYDYIYKVCLKQIN